MFLLHRNVNQVKKKVENLCNFIQNHKKLCLIASTFFNTFPFSLFRAARSPFTVGQINWITYSSVLRHYQTAENPLLGTPFLRAAQRHTFHRVSHRIRRGVSFIYGTQETTTGPSTTYIPICTETFTVGGQVAKWQKTQDTDNSMNVRQLLGGKQGPGRPARGFSRFHWV